MGQLITRENQTTPMRARINPYMVYRNPKDDKVMQAIQQAAKECREQGKPLFNPATTPAEISGSPEGMTK